MKWLWGFVGALVLGIGSANAQTILPSSSSQYPAPGPLSPTDCLLGLQNTSPTLPHTRCFALNTLANFLALGGTGIGVNPGASRQMSYYAMDGQVLSPFGGLGNAVVSTGSDGTPQQSTTLPPGITAPLGIFQPQQATQAGLPTVSGINQGTWAWVTDCQNGTEGLGAGTGCFAHVNVNGSWILDPNPVTDTITVAGQTIHLVNGASVIGAGAGSKVATTDGSGINGHVPQFNAAGTLVDSGAGPGGGGGSGTIAAGLQNQLGYYAANGTTISPLAIVNSAVLVTSNSGVPSEATTLPAALTIPNPTLSTANLTGNSTYTVLAGSGKLTTAASVIGGAGLNVPAGTAPTSPVQGDIWGTTTAFLGRLNGATSGFAMTTNGGPLTATSPVSISAAGLIACTTCATTTNGGALTATTPVTISAGGVIAVGNEISHAIGYFFDDQTIVHNSTFTLIPKFPFTSGHVTSVDYITGGTSTPSYSLAISVNGVAVTGCSALTVNTTGGSTNCTSTAITANQPLTFTVSGVLGQPTTSSIQVHFTSTIL